MYKFRAVLIITLTNLLISSSIFAQTPEKMSYQAVIRNSSDALVTNTQIRMEINILQGTASGTEVYTETQTPTTNANGLVSIEIGGGAGFNAIDWSAGPYFIETKTDPTGGTNYTITGTSQLLSVPFALHAKTAETVSGGITETDPVFTVWDKDYNDLTNKPIPWDSSYSSLKNKPIAISDFTLNANSQNITNLADPTDAQDAATKSYVDALLARIVALEELELLNNGFVDSRDGNHYDVVKIGNQLWMAENLAYLPSVVGPATGSQTTPYYYVYGYNGTNVADAKASANYTTYGVLYNWPAAMAGSVSSTANPSGVQGVCPTGWHLPSDAEWTELSDYLGGESVAGGKLKETGTTHWNSPNTGATNETGFTALPGGYRLNTGTFYGIGNYGFWWSATENNTNNAWSRIMYYNYSYVLRVNGYDKELGFSVRCVRD